MTPPTSGAGGGHGTSRVQMRVMDATPPRPRGFVRMHYRDRHLHTVFFIQGFGEILC